MNNGNSDLIGVEVNKPLFIQIETQFNDLNEQQSRLISCIQDKLQSVISKKSLEDKSRDTVAQIPIASDFQSSIKIKLAHLGTNTDKLSQVLAHLNEIV